MIVLTANESIRDDNGVLHHIVVDDREVIKNLAVIYPGEKGEAIRRLIKNSPKEGFHFIDRFHQFVILFMFDPQVGLSMKISDFKGNVDLGLDEYRILMDNDWDQEDINKIMQIIVEINEKPSPDAVLINLRSLPI
jgi:hypothetical protein